MNKSELAWCAGFFDGEGWISTTMDYPRIEVAQVHVEPLERLQQALNVGVISGPHKQTNPNSQDYYAWNVNGFERCQYVICCLWPYLCSIKKGDAKRQMLRSRGANLKKSRLKEGAPRPSERTHCPADHEYTVENTYYSKDNKRHCRTCRREQARKHYHEIGKFKRNGKQR